MSMHGQSSRKLELQGTHKQDFQRPVPFLVQNNPHQRIRFPSSRSANSIIELQGDGIPGPHFRSDAIWQGHSQNGNSTTVPAAQQLLWSHAAVNNSSAHGPFFQANQPGQLGAPDLMNLPQGVSNLFQMRREPHALWNAIENSRLAGPIMHPQKPALSAPLRTNISGGMLLPDAQDRLHHLLHTSEPDSADSSTTQPVSGEYALARRRRAFILKLSRPHRRAAAAAATKTRAALAMAMNGGTTLDVKSAEEVQQIEKKQRRVSNRDSVERCRNKQKLRLFNLEKEREELAQENEAMKEMLNKFEGCGVL